MWRWTVLSCLLIFYGHTSSQPVTDDSENARRARELNFGECCPCPVPGQGSPMPAGDDMFARARDIDDCPCRPRSSDSEGASSIFFPTLTRSDGNFVRPEDKIEDLKPLLHPEVDLASSVLQTLRDATEEEYQDALARDAARSVAKAAEETIFGDTLPEASNGNIVTIIVNPKHTDSLDDIIPQETHVQESRCIHAPLENVNSNLGQMRVAQKPPSLLRDLFGLPRANRPTGLSHGNLLDMDNSASNIQEHIVQVDDDQGTDKTAIGLKKFAPLMKLDKDIKDKFTNMKSNVDTRLKKVPDFKLPSMKNKLKDLISNIPTLDGKNKTNSSPSIPNMRLNNSLLKAKDKTNEDLSLAASNIHEQAKKSFFQTKSHLDNILQHSKPVGLKTLLKLKDVEFVPLKDLITKAAERPTRPELIRPKFAWPDIFNKGDKEISSNKQKSPLSVARSTEKIEKMTTFGKDKFLDAEVSPSNAIEQITEDNCRNKAFKITETDGEGMEPKIAATEVIDAESSPSEIQEIVSDTSNDFANNQSNELAGITDELPDNANELPGNTVDLPDNSDQLLGNADDCNTKTFPDSETDSSQSSIENGAQGNNEDEFTSETSQEITSDNAKVEEHSESEFITNDDDCVSNINNGDSITDSNNNINHVLKPTDTDLENVDESLVNEIPEIQEPCSQELSTIDTTTLDIIPKTKSAKPISSLDKTLSSIKEKIAKHIEELNNPKTISQILNPQMPSNIIENIKESSPITDKMLDSDCQNEGKNQVTTVKPDKCDDDLKNDENEADDDKVSMQDLQKLSDEMLKEEQKREFKTLNCSESAQYETDAKEPLELNNVETENIDTEPSANTQNEVVMDPQNIVDIDEKPESTCESDFKLPKQSLEQESDANVAASEVVINRALQSDGIIGSPLLLSKVLQPNQNGFSLLNNPLPDIQNIKFAPLPTLDDIKLGFTNMFDTPERDAGEHLASEAASMTDTSNILAPIMSTDASAKHFQSLLPPLRLEDVDLDILQLRPQSNLFSKFPKLDLHSFRTKLPLPTDFRIKPMKLQSAFEDQGGLLGATLSLGQNNPWATIPSLDDFGTQIKANTQKIAKTLRKPDTLRHSLKSSQGIGGSLESKFRGATTKPVNLQTNDLLEAISRNHEDFNDKLRALHIDFNDRLETMRNNLFDTSIFGSGESRSTKSFSSFSTKNKDKKTSLKSSQPQSLSSRKESKKPLKPRRLEKQRETRIGSAQGLTNKFKMPTAASVPVPRTIKVPELKATLTKSPGLGTGLGFNPIFQNKEASQPKESTMTLWKQASKKLPIANTRLGKTMNPFKDSKIKVSFSTTPRPALPSRLQSKKLPTPSSLSLLSKLGKTTGRLGQRLDHNGSPSEMRHSIVAPPISSHLDQQNFENYGMESESRQTVNLEQPKESKDLQSWPKASESAFLSKVKEAVKARMSKVNSPATFKQAGTQSVSSSFGDNGKVLNTNTDMARSASTDIDVIEGQALKENVSYKCTMVCTKE